mmetsp:Transcript_108681/g.188007  ORF Transcript_108681/g.188007 Transcript_108681/m.188007 type:complete len:217 (-) Transcript_108681:2333-2983(-)
MPPPRWWREAHGAAAIQHAEYQLSGVSGEGGHGPLQEFQGQGHGVAAGGQGGGLQTGTRRSRGRPQREGPRHGCGQALPAPRDAAEAAEHRQAVRLPGAQPPQVECEGAAAQAGGAPPRRGGGGGQVPSGRALATEAANQPQVPPSTRVVDVQPPGQSGHRQRPRKERRGRGSSSFRSQHAASAVRQRGLLRPTGLPAAEGAAEGTAAFRSELRRR